MTLRIWLHAGHDGVRAEIDLAIGLLAGSRADLQAELEAAPADARADWQEFLPRTRAESIARIVRDYRAAHAAGRGERR